MKDSGIEWVGYIPHHWNVEPIRSCFDEVVEKNKEGLVKNALKFTYGNIIPKTNFDADEDDYVADTILNYYIVNPGTIMINGLNLNFDLISQRTGLVKERGIITSAYLGLIPKDFSVTLPEFMNYLFKAYDYRMAFHNMGGGVRKILNFARLKSQKVIFPSIEEQRAIVSYLDDRCSKLDEIITEAEKSIEEYKELKQAVITEAVTKGLRNSSITYSGDPNIGEISVGWNVCKTLYGLIMPITDGPHTTPVLYDEGVPFISAEAVSCGQGSIDFDHMRGYISEEFYQECCKKYIPAIDDIYMIKSGATTGRVSMVDTDRKFTIWSPLAVFRVNSSRLIPRYLYYFLQSKPYQQQVQLGWTFGTQQNIGMRTLEKLKICMPPLDEQSEIAYYLDARVGDMDALISEKQSLIEDLQAYKKSLIYEVVTGKRRVV